MRDAFLFSVILMVTFSIPVFADDSLVAYWPLDGDATDNSGNGHDGTIFGGGIWGTGTIGSAIQLDGVNDYVLFSDYPGITGSANRTCCAWIKTTSAPGEILTWGTAAVGQKWIMRVYETGELRIEVQSGHVTGTTKVNDGQWHHVAVVLDSTDIYDAQLYVDGQLETSFLTHTSRMVDTTCTLPEHDVRIGCHDATERYFEGLIDDVRIYDRALSGEEIADFIGPALSVSDMEFTFTVLEAGTNPDDQILTIANSAGGTLNWSINTMGKPDWLTIAPISGVLGYDENESVTLSADITGLADGQYSYTFEVVDPLAFNGPQTVDVTLCVFTKKPVAHWKLDGDFLDSSSNAHDGTFHDDNASGVQWVDGVDGQAIDLADMGDIVPDYVDDYIEIAGYPGITGSQPRTCMAWIKTTDGGDILSWGNNLDVGTKWRFRTTDGCLRIQVQVGNSNTPDMNLDDGNWHHVAVVLPLVSNPTVEDLELYVDGTRITNLTVNDPENLINTAADNTVKIGVFDYLGAGLDYFNGQIDDVRIYDKALSAEEISIVMSEPWGHIEIWVDDDYTPEGYNDGHTWGLDAFSTIQAGIDSAGYGVTVHVAGGTYVENITLKNGVHLIGAGADTIIEGYQNGTVVTSSNCGPATLLEGFVITSDYNYNYNYDYGGGMYNYRSSPTVTNCIFSNNRGSYGGGMCNLQSSPTVTNCTFSGNRGSYGGGMCNLQSSPTVSHCTFSENIGDDSWDWRPEGYGGGMYNEDSNPTVSHCTFSGNTANYGGGMYNRERGLSLDGYRDYPYDGSYSIQITGCSFDGNRAYSAGGGIYGTASDLTISNCKFVSNVAEDSFYEKPFYDLEPTIGKGGALYLAGDSNHSCEMVNCTLTGNRAYEAGGGLWLLGGGQLTNCTFSANSAYDGGGVFYFNEGDFALTNCILWGNTASNSGNEICNYYDYAGLLPVISYSDIAGCGGSGAGWNGSMGIDGGGNIDADPLFQNVDIGGATQFDGADDYVEVPGYTGISGGGSRSCCAWIRTGSTETSPILSWGEASAGRRWRLYLDASGTLSVRIGSGVMGSAAVLNDNNWHHVAVVLDDDGSANVNEIKLYVDGVYQEPVTTSDRLVDTGTEFNVRIGTDLDKTAYFDGLIDEVRIYSRTLSLSEIQQVMNDDNAPTTDLEAYWQLDGNAEDASGNGRDGVLYGGPDWVTEDSVDVVDLDGADDYVEIPGYTGISGGGSRSCCAWIRTGSTETSPILSWGEASAGRRWRLYLDASGTLSVRIGSGAMESAAVLNDNNWHHVAAVLDDDGSANINEIKLYIDGVYEPPATADDRLVDTGTEFNVRIGTDLDKTAYFDGLIDEVRIYSRTLSLSEIQQVMNDDNAPTTDLEAYWQLDGNAEDASGNGRDGVLYGGPDWVTEDSVDVVDLDGADDYVEVPGYTGISGGGSRSCCAWIRTGSTTETSPILSWGEASAGRRWRLYLDASGTLSVRIGSGAMESAAVLNDNNWHHVAAVLDDDGSANVNEIKLYIDGVYEPPATADDRLVDTGTEFNVRIGTDLDKTAYFDGLIDEVRIYSRTLSLSEIQQVMNDDNAPTTDLEAYWQLDGNAEDASGNGRDGVLYGGPDWTMEDSIDNDGNLRLKPCSPCIDAGDKEALPDDILTDLDGYPRVKGLSVDMGAYEFQNTQPAADAGEDQIVYAWIDGLAAVYLDGTGSYDDDGDALEYFWYNANELIATGAEPNVVLGVGEHIIGLIVNDGVEDSEPDSCVVTVEPAAEVSVWFTPKSLNCESHGRWIKAHFTMPAEYTIDDVNLFIPCTLEPFGLASTNMQASYNEQGQVVLTVSFDRGDFCAMNPPTGFLELTAVGRLNSGHYFYASDEIRVRDTQVEQLLRLAAHWLEEDCGKPDWCDGQDVNRDTVVNLKDFALGQ